jgi:hypothetical protein
MNPVSMRTASILAAMVLLVTAGCATQRSSQPRITASPRTGLSVDSPILFSVFDARSSDSKSSDAASVLEKDLKKVYRGSIESTEYFSEVPEGRVAVKVRLKANKANFGSRIVSTSTVEQSFSTARAEASSAWSSVVVTASETQTTLGSTVQTEGWWVGTSWVELKIIDNRGDSRSEFTIPVIAEKKRSNTLGYRTANKVTEEAWSRVEQQLLQVMDEVLLTVRNQQE